MDSRNYVVARPEEPVRKKRMRLAFSCTNCRHSKQKCNREKPCMTCILRGKQDSCAYGDESRFRSFRPYRLPGSVKSLDVSALEVQDPPSHPAKDGGWSPDLACFGYSNVNVHNSLGIVKRLERLELGNATQPAPRKSKTISLSPAAYESYRSILRHLPCPACVRLLVDIYFDEFNWVYCILDRNTFSVKLDEYYLEPVPQPDEAHVNYPSDKLVFSALLFQVLATALQFIPLSFSPRLHPSCISKIPVDADDHHDDAVTRILRLAGKDAINIVFIQTQLLRTAWLKNHGLIAAAWHVLADAGVHAQELGLHKDDGKLYASDAETACEQLWDMVERRRLIVNLLLWDSQMGTVLGKSLNFNFSECTIVPPIDCEIPRNRQSTAPSSRSEDEAPNSFTPRLLEYPLHKHLYQVRALEAEGPYPRDYGKVERLHRVAEDYIETLPAIYRFDNPDRSFDDQCSMLAAQREFFCGTIWLFILLLHRPYIFSIAKSRTEIIKAGIQMLYTQQRFFSSLRPHHYAMFTLTYLSVEPCVAMLAAIITFPQENNQLVPEALRCIRETLTRLNTIRGSNKVAGQGADVIHNLLIRAETYHQPRSVSKSSSPNSADRASESFTTPISQNLPLNPTTEQQPLFPNFDFGGVADWSGAPPLENSQPTSTISQMPKMASYSFDETPFRPMADMTYLDLGVAQPFQLPDQTTSLASSTEAPLQFQGDFGESSFWDYFNRKA